MKALTVPAESERTLRSGLLATPWLTTAAVCVVWIVNERSASLVSGFLRRFAGPYALPGHEPVEPFTIDALRSLVGTNLGRLLSWSPSIAAVLMAALCVCLAIVLRGSDRRTEIRRMGLVRPRWQEVVVIAAALPAIGVVAWQYGLGPDPRRAFGLAGVLKSIALPMVRFGFCFLALRELAHHSFGRAVGILVAVTTAGWMLDVGITPGVSWTSSHAFSLGLECAWIAVAAWIYARWGHRIWALAFQGIGVLVLLILHPAVDDPRWTSRPFGFDTACLVSTMLLAAIWTMLCTKRSESGFGARGAQPASR
ncbi:MAG: hypothetical protein R3F34_19995 [Planctomycetota bacterium]